VNIAKFEFIATVSSSCVGAESVSVKVGQRLRWKVTRNLHQSESTRRKRRLLAGRKKESQTDTVQQENGRHKVVDRTSTNSGG